MTINAGVIKSGLFWTAIEFAFRQCALFGIAIALARLIAPSEFGLLALTAIFSAVAATLADGGFAFALMQSRDATLLDESTIFWTNIALGAVLGAAIGFAGPAIATFYGEPRLAALSWAAGLSVVLNSAILVPNTLIAKSLNYRVQAISVTCGILSGGVVSVLLALRGAGVWALVAQMLISTSITLALTLLLFPWRPVLHFSWHSLRKFAQFGTNILLAGLLNSAGSRFYTVLIGKQFSPSILAFYSRGVQTCRMPEILFEHLIGNISLPVFSANAADPAILGRQMRSATHATMAMSAAFMFGLVATAHDVVLVLWGPRWLSVAPILQAIAVGSVIYPMKVINLDILAALGHSRRFLGLDVAKQLILVSAISVASLFGIMAIAWVTAGVMLAELLLDSWYSSPLVGYGFLAQLRDVSVYVAVGIAMCALVMVLGQRLNTVDLPYRLVAEIVAGAIFYIGTLLCLRAEGMRIVRTLAFDFLSKGSQMLGVSRQR